MSERSAGDAPHGGADRLAAIIRRRIATDGAISVAAFMALALFHPEHGYYTTRDPLGRAGDFTTAPEISQMFGELLGLWAAAHWEALGSPRPVLLAELGPGRGTLMADARRATARVPGFAAAAAVHLVEPSPVLAAIQRATLGADSATWHQGLATVPEDRPLLLLANEVLDCLPVRQFERHQGAWWERQVTIGDPADGAVFRPVRALAPDPAIALLSPVLRDGGAVIPEGAVVEVAPGALLIASEIGRRVARGGGAALLVDYGYDAAGWEGRPRLGSLQALRGHRRADPWADPGCADLTAHVDFAVVARAAQQAGATVWGPLDQGRLLARLGLEERAARLAATRPEHTDAIADAVRRLGGADGMGTAFKAIAIGRPGDPPPPGFTPAEARLS